MLANFAFGRSCGNYADGLKSKQRPTFLHNSWESSCFCLSVFSAGSSPPQRPTDNFVSQPLSLFCLLLRLLFHLCGAPFTQKTNSLTPVGKETAARRVAQPAAAPRRRLGAAARAVGPREAAPAPRRVQSAFCECARVLGEKWIIVAPARTAPSHAMLGPIGSASRVFTHIRVREEKRKKFHLNLNPKLSP